MTSVERSALAMYGAMGRDVCDALDMVNECECVDTLRLLHSVLTLPPTPETDGDLNALFAPLVEKAIARLSPTATVAE